MPLLTLPVLPGLAFPVTRSPRFKRIRHESVSGKTTSQSPQPYARYGYDLPYEFLRAGSEQEQQSLLGFYVATMSANAGVFRFSDPDDKTIAGQQLGTGDGLTVDFGFVRQLGSSIDPVQDVTASGLKVYLDGVEKTLGVDFSLLTTSLYGTNYGVRFTAAPAIGAIVTADFSYTWICEFDDDSADFAKFMNQLWEVGSLKFTSVLQ